MFTIKDDHLTMEDLIQDSMGSEKMELGKQVQGTVVSMSKNSIIVDLLDGMAVGIISGREMKDSAGTVDDLNVGDEVTTVVLNTEDENGMVVLSIRKASEANAWERFEAAFKSGDILEMKVYEANKGGLMVGVDGIRGFLPASQLTSKHYPRVENANAAAILSRLKELVGKKLSVKVINCERATKKLILSEKAGIAKQVKDSLDDLSVGDIVEGTVTGVVKFGVFVTTPQGLEGLVHVSQMDWGHVDDPNKYAKVGDKVKVKVIGKEDGKISLSLKQLTEDPWKVIEEKYPIGSKVTGVINRFSSFGAFVELANGINGLIHLSEISNKKIEDPTDVLQIGQEVNATVISIDDKEHRIGLSLKGKKDKKKEKDELDKVEEEMDSVKEEKVSKKEDVEGIEEKPKKKSASKKKEESESDGDESSSDKEEA